MNVYIKKETWLKGCLLHHWERKKPSFDKYKLSLKYVIKNFSKIYIVHTTNNFPFNNHQLHLNLYPLLSFYSCFLSHVFYSAKHCYLLSLLPYIYDPAYFFMFPTSEIMPVDFMKAFSSELITAVSLYIKKKKSSRS